MKTIEINLKDIIDKKGNVSLPAMDLGMVKSYFAEKAGDIATDIYLAKLGNNSEAECQKIVEVVDPSGEGE